MSAISSMHSIVIRVDESRVDPGLEAGGVDLAAHLGAVVDVDAAPCMRVYGFDAGGTGRRCQRLYGRRFGASLQDQVHERYVV
jgi:hypothetical protein